jgi:hypothetical protein
MDTRIARFAGLGAFGACAGLLALFLLIAWVARPVPTGGINAATTWVTWISLGGLFAALIIVHVVLGRRLLLLSQGRDVRHPL